MNSRIVGLLIILVLLAAGWWSTRTTGADTHAALRSGSGPLVSSLAPVQITTPIPNYRYTVTTGTIVPGTSQVPGTNCSRCTSYISLPFPVTLYDVTVPGVRVSNKGVVLHDLRVPEDNSCSLPVPHQDYSRYVFWDDLITNIDDTMGVYTSVSGSAPNRIFNVEWRSGYIGNDVRANFEVRLYEGQDRFDFVYGPTLGGGSSATIGLQSTGSGPHMLFACNQPNVVPPGTVIRWERAP